MTVADLIELMSGHVSELALVAAIAACFVTSGTDTALFSFGTTERSRMQGRPIGRWLVTHLERMEGDEGFDSQLELTMLLLDVGATVAAAALGARVLDHGLSMILADLGPAPLRAVFAIAVLTPLLVVVPKVTGRAIAYRWREAWALAVILPVALAHLLVMPIRLLLASAVRLIGRSMPPEVDEGREDEIREIIAAGEKAGAVDAREKDIVEAVFDFGELTVGRLMTPRTEIFALPVDLPWDEVLKRSREAGYARIPVYRARGDDRTDDIKGVLLLKDLLRLRAATMGGDAIAPEPASLHALVLPPTFVPQSKPANAMLREFLLTKQHMAFVVDEHGTLVGLITLDDLLARLVGEFLDDDTSDETAVHRAIDGVIHVKAWMDAVDFVEQLGIPIPQDGYNTVGGFVFHELGRLPHKGDSVVAEGHRFTVGSMDGRRIAEILVEKVPEPQAASSPAPQAAAGKPGAA